MNGLLGKKVGMTQVFGSDGEVIPVTVIEAGPCAVLEVLSKKGVLKLGYGPVKMEKLKKPQQGYFQKLKVPPRKYIREVAFANPGEHETGGEITVSLFEPGEFVDVTGNTKGKGFSGMIKRWGASRMPMSHGHPEKRRPGSIGASATPSRVFKGKKMPGRQGRVQKTVQNLQVIEVREGDNLLLLKGAVPGPPSGFLVITKSLKKPAARKTAPEERKEAQETAANKS